MGSAYQSASRCEQQSSPAGIRSSISSKRLSRSDFCFSKQLEGMKMGDSPTANDLAAGLSDDAIALCLGWFSFGSKRSEEHTSELQSLMRISYAVFCLKKKKSMMTKITTNRMTTQIYNII